MQKIYMRGTVGYDDRLYGPSADETDLIEVPDGLALIVTRGGHLTDAAPEAADLSAIPAGVAPAPDSGGPEGGLWVTRDEFEAQVGEAAREEVAAAEAKAAAAESRAAQAEAKLAAASDPGSPAAAGAQEPADTAPVPAPVLDALAAAGYDTPEKRAAASDDDLLRVPGVGPATVSRLRAQPQ